MNISRIHRASLAVLTVSLLSCGGDGEGPTVTAPDPPRATSMTLSLSSIQLTFLGESSFLSATVLDQFQKTFSTTVTWSSDNTAIATVTAGGQVTSVANGQTTVRATAGTLTASVPVTVQQVAARVVAVSGGNQVDTVGRTLATPLVARSIDQGGSPVPGATVTFVATEGDGSLTVTSATTDAEALASTVWTLGTVARLQRVTATVPGFPLGVGSFTATALADKPVSLVKAGVQDTLGTVGYPLDNPMSVMVTDSFGNGVAGQTVSFEVTSGGGSVNPAQATTSDEGVAKTIWTLGSVLGPQGLSAKLASLPAVAFTATGEPPMPDLTPVAMTTKPANPTILDSVTVTASVTNEGRLSTGGSFDVLLRLDNDEVGRATLPPLAIGDTTEATFTLPPLTEGLHAFQLLVDPDGTVTEKVENNNLLFRNRTVAATTVVTAGVPISGLSGALETEQLFTLELPASAPGTMVIELSGGTGDVDMYVHYGERPASRDDYECQSGNPDTRERCVFNAAEPGTYYIVLYAFSEFSGTTMNVTTGGPVIPFDIEVVFITHGSTAQDAAFVEAAKLWSEIITSDITDVDFTDNPIEAGTCHDGQPLIAEMIDDLRIYVDIVDIDGPGGTLARAGPCIVRGLSELPILGSMEFDSGDLALLGVNDGLLPVILHEMGHVLGIGTIWNRHGLLRLPSLPNNTGADTHFAGPKAIEAFDAAGGTSKYTLGAKVPVENVAGEGSGDSHWRESVLGVELMTPFFNGGQVNPLSAISIASLRDLGYKVDMSRAEPFSKVYSAPPAEPVSGDAAVIDLRGDVRTGPILVVDEKGRVREIRR